MHRLERHVARAVQVRWWLQPIVTLRMK
ncbi:hypothetical protein M3J09_008376 [Ascochyta lentis]